MNTDLYVANQPDTATSGAVLTIKKPFEIMTLESKKYVNFEVSSPVTIVSLKDLSNNLSYNTDSSQWKGRILNFSPNGLLMEIDQSFRANEILLMGITIQGIDKQYYVLGQVKKVESFNNSYLVGIEMPSKSALQNCLSEAEIEMLSNIGDDFMTQLMQTINEYIEIS